MKNNISHANARILRTRRLFDPRVPALFSIAPFNSLFPLFSTPPCLTERGDLLLVENCSLSLRSD